MRITAKTDIGLVRTDNQDSYSAGELSGGVAWAVVCDGMGGAAGGSVASSTSVKMISHTINECYRDGMKPSSIYNMFESAIAGANACLYDKAKSDDSLAGMGTTCVAAIVANSRVYVAHVGDSRAYRISEKNGISQLTRDHSMVQDLVENGSITADEAKTFPGKNIITRAIGVDSRVAVDFVEDDFEEGDILLLCTDGLTNFVEDEAILSASAETDFFEYAERLVEMANKNGGGDNITVVSITT
ncbi:MAG: Stp1/IreP family PP2C-type Ser/Thr phosphatase [Clostridia bacterium]|nr:Stp1/IreP family PP2C-type Ser/Thr phosphatase [Clostridia bacterium]